MITAILRRVFGVYLLLLMLIVVAQIWGLQANQTIIALHSRDTNNQFAIIAVDLTTNVVVRLSPTSNYNDIQPSYSPDGTQIAFVSDREGQSDIYIMDANGLNSQRVGHTLAYYATSPTWSPDGQQLAFIQQEITGLEADVFIMTIVTGERRRLVQRRSMDDFPSWQGDTIVMQALDDNPFVLRLVRMDSDGQNVEAITGHNQRSLNPLEFYFAGDPALSPDAKTIAFIMDGGSAIALLPSNGGQVQVLDDACQVGALSSPAWHGDGTTIFYVSECRGDYRLRAYDMITDTVNEFRLPVSQFDSLSVRSMN